MSSSLNQSLILQPTDADRAIRGLHQVGAETIQRGMGLLDHLGGRDAENAADSMCLLYHIYDPSNSSLQISMHYNVVAMKALSKFRSYLIV